jgi:predicted nucleic acid-binding Zn ribbon protein
MALIRCPKCGNEVSERASSCPHCGLSLSENLQKEKLKCPECSSELPDNATFCPNCGYPIRKENKKPINTKLFFVISGILVVTILGFIVLKVVTSKTKNQIQPSVAYLQSVQEVYERWKRAIVGLDLDELKNLYADSVFYYGKKISKEEILKDKESYKKALFRLELSPSPVSYARKDTIFLVYKKNAEYSKPGVSFRGRAISVIGIKQTDKGFQIVVERDILVQANKKYSSDELMLENKNIVIDQEEAKEILAKYLKVSVGDIYDVGGYYNFGNDIRYVFTHTDDITPLRSQTDIFTVNAISGEILSVGKICRIEFYISPKSELSTSCGNLRKPAKYVIVKGSLDGDDITYSISTNEGEILNCYRCSSSELNYEGEIKPNKGPFYIEAYNEALFNSKSLNLTIVFLYYKPSAMGDFGKQIDNLFFYF